MLCFFLSLGELLPLCGITESQNHRMVGIGRDLCGSTSPTLLPKQGHLQQAAEDLVQAGLEYLQRRRLHNLPGQPVLVLCHPQREEILPPVQTELPVLPVTLPQSIMLSLLGFLSPTFYEIFLKYLLQFNFLYFILVYFSIPQPERVGSPGILGS